MKYSESGIILLVVRKTFPEIKRSCLPLITRIFQELDVPFIENKADHIITLGKAKIHFISMDEKEKFKSFESDATWVEETTEITEDEFRIIRNVTRHQGPVLNQIIMSFNPIDQFHWTIRKFVQGNNPEAAIMHSTYKDNLSHLPPEYVRELEGYEKEDENFYRVYTMGLPGILKGLIYSKWDVIEKAGWPEHIRNRPPDAFALDFGVNVQTAMYAHWADVNDDYGEELLYQTGMTNSDLLGWLDQNNIPKNIITYADPAEKNRILELQRAGYMVTEAQNAVKDGIDYCKSRMLHLAPDSVNAIAETRSYKYREIKFQGEVRVLDEPVKIRDHLMDAMRYARFSSRAMIGGSEGLQGIADWYKAGSPGSSADDWRV